MAPFAFALAALLAALQDPKEPPRKQPQDLTEMSLEDLLKIEVTSVSKREQQLIDAPAAITVIRGEDLRRTGATSVPEALRLVPGVFVGHLDSNKWAVGVRGFNDLFSNKLLVLIDGRSVYNPLFSGVFWDAQDTLLEDVERIEVIRGPGGTLWGANAVNGVINVTTKRAKDTQGGLVSVLGGNQEQLIAGARYGGKAGEDLYYRAYVKHLSRDAYTGGDDDWQASRAGFRTEWTPHESRTITLQGDVYTGESNQRWRVATLSAPFTNVFAAPARMSGGNVLARYEQDGGPGTQFRAQAYWDRTVRTGDILDETRDTVDFDVQYRFPLLGSHEVTIGAGYRWTTAETDGSFTFSLDPRHRTDGIGSAFIQDEIKLIEDRLTLTLGSKFEYNDYTGYEYQPGARLSWRPHERHAVWASASRAVRTPSQIEEDGQANIAVQPPSILFPFPTAVRFVGDPDFRSEVLMAYELGYRFRPVDPLLFDIATFFNDYRSLRTSELGTFFTEPPAAPPSNGVQPLIADNNLSGHTYGVELAATWQVQENLRLYGTYTFLRMHLHTTDLNTDGSGKNVERSSPRNMASLRASWDPVQDVTVDLIGRYVESVQQWDVRHYVELDARVGWMITKNLEAAVVGQNLLHTSHFETNDSQIGNFATKVQRGAYLSLTWRF
ncbi:MAG TPA: TonB-dependent receptor [Planctomycetota bacterium]|nr:TonB-dependent receptor [Planctomycetota bacterium]